MTQEKKLRETVASHFKKYIFVCIVAITALAGVRVQAQTVPLLVDVPVPPEQITRLDEKSNYIVNNFWKRLNFKGAFSSNDRMDATFGQFICVTPYATADTVYMAIDFLIKGVEKADAKNLLTLAKIAEKWCGTDSAEYASEELMLPFAQAVANSKKIKGPEKDHYAAMAKRLANSRVGVAPADFAFIVPDGTTAHFSEVSQPTVLIFFYDPNDFDSRLARTRIANDFVIKTLSQRELLKVVAIYPGNPDAEWQKDIDNMPANWIIGASPEVGQYFTMNRKPQMYYLDQDRTITDKDFSVDAILSYFGQFIKR